MLFRSAKSLSFIPFFIFIRTPEHYKLVPIFYSIGYIFAGLISIYIVYFQMGMKWYFTPFAKIRYAFKDSSMYFLSRASTSLFTTSNSFLIGLVCGNVAVGYYSAAEKLYQAYNQLLLPFTGVLFPHIAKNRDAGFFKKVFYRISSTNILSVILVLCLSTFILKLVYNTDDPNILSVFRILICACFVTIPSMLMGYPFLAAMGHPLYTNWTVILTSVVHITGLFILYLCNSLFITSVAAMVVFSESLLDR